MLRLKVTNHGSPKSNYDAQVRAIASQYQTVWEFNAESLKSNITADIGKIKRANTAVASACYSVKIKNQFEVTERIEIWNEVFPGKERLIVTIEKEVANG